MRFPFLPNIFHGPQSANRAEESKILLFRRTPRLRRPKVRSARMLPDSNDDPRTLGIWASRLTMRSASGGTRIFNANTGTWFAPTNPKP